MKCFKVEPASDFAERSKMRVRVNHWIGQEEGTGDCTEYPGHHLGILSTHLWLCITAVGKFQALALHSYRNSQRVQGIYRAQDYPWPKGNRNLWIKPSYFYPPDEHFWDASPKGPQKVSEGLSTSHLKWWPTSCYSLAPLSLFPCSPPPLFTPALWDHSPK